MQHTHHHVRTADAFYWMRSRQLSSLVPAFVVCQAEECIAVKLRYTCNMKLVHDPGGRVRRDLAADVKGYALFGGSRREYRYVLRRVWDGQERLLPETCKFFGITKGHYSK
jgi:hypothetical protein